MTLTGHSWRIFQTLWGDFTRLSQLRSLWLMAVPLVYAVGFRKSFGSNWWNHWSVEQSRYDSVTSSCIVCAQLRQVVKFLRIFSLVFTLAHFSSYGAEKQHKVNLTSQSHTGNHKEALTVLCASCEGVPLKLNFKNVRRSSLSWQIEWRLNRQKYL